jgi:hypothetical protein
MTVEVRRPNFTFNDLRTTVQQEVNDNNQQLDDDGDHISQLDDGDDNERENRGPARPFVSTFQRGDPVETHDDHEQAFWSFFQTADDYVASTLLAGQIAHMHESIEDERKHKDLAI